MKKILMLVLLVAFSGCASLSGTVVKNYDADKIVHYSKISGITGDIGNYAFYIDMGDKIPVSLNVETGFVKASDKVDLISGAKLYFTLNIPAGIEKMDEKERNKALKDIRIYISKDAVNWTPYTNLKAVKKMLGIEKGSVSYGASITKEEGLKLNVDVMAGK
jgi:hypothetical protein